MQEERQAEDGEEYAAPEHEAHPGCDAHALLGASRIRLTWWDANGEQHHERERAQHGRSGECPPPVREHRQGDQHRRVRLECGHGEDDPDQDPGRTGDPRHARDAADERNRARHRAAVDEPGEQRMHRGCGDGPQHAVRDGPHDDHPELDDAGQHHDHERAMPGEHQELRHQREAIRIVAVGKRAGGNGEQGGGERPRGQPRKGPKQRLIESHEDEGPEADAFTPVGGCAEERGEPEASVVAVGECVPARAGCGRGCAHPAILAPAVPAWSRPRIARLCPARVSSRRPPERPRRRRAAATRRRRAGGAAPPTPGRPRWRTPSRRAPRPRW